MNTKFFRWTVSLAAILGMSVTLTGCGDGEKDSAKLLSGEKKLSAEEERIQKLLKIRVWDEAAGKWDAITAADLVSKLGMYSHYRGEPISIGGVLTNDLCIGEDPAEPGLFLSMAIALNKVARSLVPIVVPVTKGEPAVAYRIPPQDHTARVGLYYAARANAYWAIGAVNGLLSDETRSLTRLCNNEGQIQGEQLAEITSVAYDIFVDSTNGAVESSVIAGDILRARASSESEGRIWQFSAEEFSRSAAAHLIGGGPSGWNYNTRFDPYCASAPLSPTVRRAVNLMRIAAPNPFDLLDPNLSTEDLLGNPSVASGNLTERLATLLPMPSLLNAGVNLTTELNVPIEDFREARSYMQKEIVSNLRTSKVLPDGIRYAGTASAPTALPSAAFSALTRREDWGHIEEITSPTAADLNLLDALHFNSSPNLDLFNSRMAMTLRSEVGQAINRIAMSDVSASDKERLKDGLKAPLLGLLERITSQAWGSIAFQHHLSAGNWDLTVSVGTKLPNVPIRFVRGYDGLRCVLQGSAEGAACDGSEVIPMEVFESSHPTGAGFLPYVQSYRYYLEDENDFIEEPVFVVDDSAGTPKVAFGAYVDVAPSVAPIYMNTLVFEESNQRLERLLAMNGSWCGETKYDCMGNNVAERMPLENELSKDELDVESSWKRYLEMAKQAAAESELRGKEYLEAGLEVEFRKEEIWKDRDSRARQAIEQLQEICGTTMDPSKLLATIGGAGFSPPASQTCSMDSTCNASGAGDDYKCVAGQCVVNFAALTNRLGANDPELARLARCVSGEVLPAATPGDAPLCYWVDQGNVNAICQNSNGSLECPRTALVRDSDDPGVACKDFAKPEDNLVDSGKNKVWKVVPTSGTLKYFAVAATTPNESTESIRKVCQNLRAIRADLGGSTIHGTGPALTPERKQQMLQEIGESGLFHPDNFGSRASGWTFETQPESNMRISLRGTQLWTTGRVGLEGNTPTTNWPCGAAGRPSDCSVDGGRAAGIFCDYAGHASGADPLVSGCTDAWARGNYAQRLRRASLAIALARPVRADGEVVVGSSYDKINDNAGDGSTRARPCDGPEVLVQRAGKAPIRQRTCGNTVMVAVDSEVPTDRTIWYGGLGEYKGSSAENAPNPPVADWVFDSGRNDWELRVRTGRWSVTRDMMKFNYRRKMYGILNGLSHATQWEIEDPWTPTEKWLSGVATRLLIGKEQVVGADDSTELNSGAILDGLELYCEAQVVAGNECTPGAAPLRVSSGGDLSQAGKYLQCVGDTILSRASKSVMARIPALAMDALRKTSAIGAFPLVGGKYGEAVGQLRAALVELSDVGPAIASEVRQMGNDVESIAAALKINELQSQMADAQFLSSMSNAVAACGSAGPWGYAAQCANALAQTQFLGQIKNLQKESAEQAGIRDLAQFRSQLETRSRTLAAYGTRITAALEGIDTQLSALEGLRISGQRRMSDALYAASFAAPNSEAIDNTLGWRFQEARRRYEESTKVSRSLAVIARRAIEQRLAIRLESLKDPLPLVDAPSTWVQGICQAEGLNFEDIATIDDGTPDPGETYKSFLGSFVVDYVGRLEKTIESYRMSFPFQDGVDEAIVSVRNDLVKARSACELPSPNLVRNSGKLDLISGSDVAGTGWTEYECLKSGSSEPFAGCIGVSPGAGTYTPPGVAPINFYYLDFNSDNCTSVGCSSSSSPKFGSKLSLNPGWYNLSYYTWELASDSCFLTAKLLDSTGTLVTFEAPEIPAPLVAFGDGSYIVRNTRRARVDLAGDYTLQFGESNVGGCWGPGATSSLGFLADVMLAKQAAADWSAARVPAYVPANAGGNITTSLCQDNGGIAFRNENWSEPRCVRLCGDGYSNACDERTGRLECYRELRFSLDESRIEASEQFQGAGFAKGNYNYRIEQIGVNFVGTGVKDCSKSATPDSCYSNANIQYSIEHLGPFMVRNHMGDDVESKIVNGRIEHARGLATERYLTNPLSSTDRALMDPYVRNEFQGRPLGGEYVLRVWESPEVNFDRIDDVQFFLRYRYWTRQK